MTLSHGTIHSILLLPLFPGPILIPLQRDDRPSRDLPPVTPLRHRRLREDRGPRSAGSHTGAAQVLGAAFIPVCGRSKCTDAASAQRLSGGHCTADGQQLSGVVLPGQDCRAKQNQLLQISQAVAN